MNKNQKLTLSFSDTDKITDKKYFELIKSLSPEERFKRITRMNSYGRKVILESIKHKNPQANEKELRILLAERLHGKEFVKKYL